MENTRLKIISRHAPQIYIEAVPGHFITSHSHINYYIDITEIKHEQSMARHVAKYMATDYNAQDIQVDTIICMDGIDVLGAYLARELAKPNIMSVNPMKDIHVIPTEFNSGGQMIFRDNLVRMVEGKNCLLLIASVTTGKTIKRSLECIDYYRGNVVGISAVFSAEEEVQGKAINAMFTSDDVPDYRTFSYHECPQCKAGTPVDALVNSYGYSQI